MFKGSTVIWIKIMEITCRRMFRPLWPTQRTDRQLIMAPRWCNRFSKIIKGLMYKIYSYQWIKLLIISRFRPRLRNKNYRKWIIWLINIKTSFQELVLSTKTTAIYFKDLRLNQTWHKKIKRTTSVLKIKDG